MITEEERKQLREEWSWDVAGQILDLLLRILYILIGIGIGHFWWRG